MSADWIEGEFEGIYSGLRRQPSRRKRGRKARRPGPTPEARRFAFEIQSGRVRDFLPCPAPEPGEQADERLIRQARVRRIRLEEEAGEGAAPAVENETSLFDVHITDWKLKHPAEDGDRAYGTIVGTIRARRRPAIGPAPLDRDPPVGDGAERARDESDDAASRAPERVEIVESPGWAFVLLLVQIVLVALAHRCGARLAVVWLAPVAFSLWLYWATAGGLVRGVPRWLVAVIPVLQVVALRSGLEAAWQTGCWTTPTLGALAVLGVAVPLAAMLGSRSALWMTAIVWTGVLCVDCARPGATTCGSSVVAGEVGAAEAPLDGSRSPVVAPRAPRTDAEGRWPVMPPAPGSASAGSGRGASTGPSPGLHGAAGFGSMAGAGLAMSGRSSVGPAATAEGVEASLPGPTSFARPARGSHLDAGVGGRTLTGIDGGWLSPDHRRAPRQHTLISVEQANRTPPLFFESGGAHRVYVPTDGVFEQGSATLRPKAALVLARVAALLGLDSERRVVLEVHTDSSGSPESQVELARRRAASVRSWLLDRGHVPAERFGIEAVGGARPLVPPDGDYGAQLPNRRIEIRLVEPGVSG